MKIFAKRDRWLLLIVLLVIGGCFAQYPIGMAMHVRRVDGAVATMSRFTEADWKTLYEQGMSLYGKVTPGNVAIDKNLWPPLIAKLQPGHVWVHEDRVHLNWTGGFSPRLLRLDIMRRTVIEPQEYPRPKGIIVTDGSRTIPEHPYLIEEKGKNGQQGP